MCDLVVFTFSYCYFLQVTFIFKHLLVILLLLQLTPTGVTTYPIDGAQCNAFLKYLNSNFSSSSSSLFLFAHYYLYPKETIDNN